MCLVSMLVKSVKQAGNPVVIDLFSSADNRPRVIL